MTDTSDRRSNRRPELDRAFRHLAAVGSEVDLSGITDPDAQWLRAMRTVVPRYGDVGPSGSLDGVAFRPVTANGVPAEWVTAEGASNARRIVWIHGGGWVAGSARDFRALSATLARLSGASILIFDYRLAPEHRFPAGLDDCVAAVAWAAVNGPESAANGSVDADPAERIGLAGDSAGGNLAAATCVRLARSEHRMPDRLAIVAGTLDNVSLDGRVGIDDFITPEALSRSLRAYLPPFHDVADPLVSPVTAPPEILHRFPPTLIQASAIEALLHDAKIFAARLGAAGVRVNLSVWPGLPHVWHAFLGLFPESTTAIGEIADFMHR